MTVVDIYIGENEHKHLIKNMKMRFHFSSISRVCTWKLVQYGRVKAAGGHMREGDLSLNFGGVTYFLWASDS